MNDKQQLEELNKAVLQRLQEYAKKKEHLSEEHQQKLNQAKEEYNASWAKLMDVLMVLERIEI